jgi:hypothetical protein
LSGRADFHALSAAGVTIYGFDGLTAAVMRSDDGGQRWQQGARFAMTDLDVDPENPLRVVSATPAGVQESQDGGMTFTAAMPQPPRPLALLDQVPYRAAPAEIPCSPGWTQPVASGRWGLGVGTWQALSRERRSPSP